MNKYILILFSILLPSNLYAASIEIGFRSNQASVLVLDNKENELGEIFSDFNESLYMSLKSQLQTFDNSNWGYFVELNSSSFYLDKQNFYQQTNIGTSIKAFYTHLTPVLFYNISSFNTFLGQFRSLVGVGAGISYIKLDGTIKTDLAPATSTLNVKGSGFGTTAGIYFEASLNNFIFRVSSYAPSTNIGTYTYDLYDNSLSLSYRVEYDMAEITSAFQE